MADVNDEEIKVLLSDDYYAVLGVEKDVDLHKIQKAYKKRALKWHPDKAEGDVAEKVFVNINEAYAVLSDDKQRAIYDKVGKEGLSASEGQMTAEEAKNLFKKAVDNVFIYGYKDGEEPDMPSSKHGRNQAIKGAVKAPLVGAGLGVVAAGAGVVMGAGQILGGFFKGGKNVVDGWKEVGQAMKDKKKKGEQQEAPTDSASEPQANPEGNSSTQEGETEQKAEGVEGEEPPAVPSVKAGLYKATVGAVAEPVKGVFQGVGTALVGGLVGLGSIGAGVYGAVENVSQGRKEIKAANTLAKQLGIPEDVQRGDKLREKRLLELLEDKEVMKIDPDEIMLYFFCVKKGTKEKKASSEEQKEDGPDDAHTKTLKQREAIEALAKREVFHCVFLTTHRLVKIKSGVVRSIINKSTTVSVGHVPNKVKAAKVIGKQEDGSDCEIKIWKDEVAAFFVAQMNLWFAPEGASTEVSDKKEVTPAQPASDVSAVTDNLASTTMDPTPAAPTPAPAPAADDSADDID